MTRAAMLNGLEPLESRLLMAVIPVLNNNGFGAGSLYEAVASASSGDTIDLTGRTGTITVSGTLNISKTLTFVGPGRDLLTISGGDVYQVMRIDDPATVHISDLTIARGRYFGGGGAIQSRGDLVLDRVTFRGNASPNALGGGGGAVYSFDGNLTATDTEFLDNTAGNAGGALNFTNGTIALLRSTFARNSVGHFGGNNGAYGGAIFLSGLVSGSIVNCTISGNATYGTKLDGIAATGGGLNVWSQGALEILGCTITNNSAGTATTAGAGGGVYLSFANAQFGTTTIVDTIIAGNHASSAGPDVIVVRGRPMETSHNLIGIIDGWQDAPPVHGVNGNLVGTAASPIDAALAPLASHVGPALTHMPRHGSPAIDAGSGALAFDQTGGARSGVADIGAAELQGPRFTSAPPRNVYLSAGQPFSYTATTAHRSGGAVTITPSQIPAWLTLEDLGNGTATLSGTANATSSTFFVSLTATDAGGSQASQSFVVHVDQTNVAPAFQSTAPPGVNAVAPYSYKLRATDGNDDALAFESIALPPWLTLEDHGDGTATLYGVAGNAYAGNNTVSVRVTDGAHSATQTFTINVTYFNHVPVYRLVTLPAATAFQPFSATFSAFDADGDRLTFTSTSKPAWMTVTTNPDGTATIGGTPTNADAGSRNFSVKISDGSAEIYQSLTISVQYINRAPAFVTPEFPTGYAKEPYTATITATDPDGDALTITAWKPPWMTFADNGDGTATIGGIPPGPGSYSFQLRVTDGAIPIIKSFTFVLPNRPPTVTATSPLAATASNPFSAGVRFADADGETFSLDGVTLPSWLNFTNNGDGTGTFSGTPTTAHVGDNTVVFHLRDPWGVVARTLTIPVAPNRVPAITSAATATGYFGVSFRATVTVADADGDDVTITAPTLPGWLALTDHGNGTATLSGLLDGSVEQVHTVVVRVSDGYSQVQQSMSIRMLPPVHLSGGLLTVVGSDTNDNIYVAIHDGRLRAMRNGAGKQFSLAGVTRVEIHGGGGNDAISVSTGSIPTYVLGGSGNDTLTGGDQRDNLVGGGGKDQLIGNGGDDRLDGHAGHDYLWGGGNKDRLYGGDGNDTLHGGTGGDKLYGQDGDDVLFARDKYIDLLLGGAGNDFATFDAIDHRNDLLSLLG